jgi:hypothetical protein
MAPRGRVAAFGILVEEALVWRPLLRRSFAASTTNAASLLPKSLFADAPRRRRVMQADITTAEILTY